MTRAWRWFARLGLLLGGTALGVGAAELVGRAAGPTGGNQLLFPSVDLYPRDLYVEAGGMNFPNPRFSGVVRSLDYSVPVQFSAWATRGPDPSADGPRWIVVGDSFTLALQVLETQTFVARLATAIGVEVINAGVDGYSTWDAGVRLAQLGREFPPSGVVLGFFLGNDFSDNMRPRGPRTADAPGRSPRPGPRNMPVHNTPAPLKFGPVGLWLHDHSVLYALGLVWRKQRAIARDTDPHSRHFKEELEFFSDKVPERLTHDLPHTAAAMVEFSRTATRLGAAASYVVVIPPAFGLDRDIAAKTLRTFAVAGQPDVETAYDAALGAAKEAGLVPCDARPELREALANGEKPYFLFDAHLTSRGHEAVADAVLRCIESARG